MRCDGGRIRLTESTALELCDKLLLKLLLNLLLRYFLLIGVLRRIPRRLRSGMHQSGYFLVRRGRFPQGSVAELGLRGVLGSVQGIVRRRRQRPDSSLVLKRQRRYIGNGVRMMRMRRLWRLLWRLLLLPFSGR